MENSTLYVIVVIADPARSRPAILLQIKSARSQMNNFLCNGSLVEALDIVESRFGNGIPRNRAGSDEGVEAERDHNHVEDGAV